MHTFDFHSNACKFALDYIIEDPASNRILDVKVGDMSPIPCELCGGLPTTHYARMVVLDARDGQPTVSLFRVCCDCWADAQREGTLIKSVPV